MEYLAYLILHMWKKRQTSIEPPRASQLLYPEH